MKINFLIYQLTKNVGSIYSHY